VATGVPHANGQVERIKNSTHYISEVLGRRREGLVQTDRQGLTVYQLLPTQKY